MEPLRWLESLSEGGSGGPGEAARHGGRRRSKAEEKESG